MIGPIVIAGFIVAIAMGVYVVAIRVKYYAEYLLRKRGQRK